MGKKARSDVTDPSNCSNEPQNTHAHEAHDGREKRRRASPPPMLRWRSDVVFCSRLATMSHELGPKVFPASNTAIIDRFNTGRRRKAIAQRRRTEVERGVCVCTVIIIQSHTVKRETP